jgi:hypothetical protein
MKPPTPRVTKEKAEAAIFARFAEAYQRHYDASLLLLPRRESPDFAAVDSVTRQTLGIEVTGAYQDDREAELNYWLTGDWDHIQGDFQSIVSAINRRLADKAKKSFSYEGIGPLVLAIWIGSFLFHHKREIGIISPLLATPENCFSLVALVITDDTGQIPLLQVLQESAGWRAPGAA